MIGLAKFAFGLPRILPLRYVAITALLMLAAVPAAVTQSVRSSAEPIAFSLVASGISLLVLMTAGNAALVSPYGLATRTALLSTGFLMDTGTVSGADITLIATASALLTLVLLTATAGALDRRYTT